MFAPAVFGKALPVFSQKAKKSLPKESKTGSTRRGAPSGNQ
jgi:hypothetical protein